MKIVFRIVLGFVLLAAAITAYSYGQTTGMFLFILAGFALETVFWFNLFPVRRKAPH
ncbi:hypothetical protein HHX48_13335 [Salinimonas sp. HHU 13199]|uniref:DUF2892 domain-containing protein n=1 Tax=Salinimonas profundi TaxID=2729140 RepID=A0ABR8LN47_9ALTE|nr:hypothetical protein [Salinimonas profundi]MBD3586725.1 hypothetical protein [Salinimonas profundi]